MIKAHHKKIWEWFFVIYSGICLRFIFREIRYTPLHSEDIDQKHPVILISNHFFFWDGFIHLLLNRKIFKRKIHIMMLHEELNKRRFLRYGGTFSIEKGRKAIIESLDYCGDILSKPDNCLLIFPQGEIESIYTHPYKFEKGIEYILKRSKDADVYFNVNLLNFNSKRRPALTMYLRRFSINQPEICIKDIEDAFNLFALEARETESTESVKYLKLL